MADTPSAKPKVNYKAAWAEAREVVWDYRLRLALGLALMLVSRLAGLVLPASSKYLIDDVIGKHHAQLLPWIALAVGTATVLQAITGFALSQVLGVAAQRAITDMRKRVQAHVSKLPVSYFDSTKTGVLISRIMSDAEGIRNLVGTGLVQLVGGFVTAAIAVGVLFWLNWKLTAVTLTVLLIFGGGMAIFFKRLRPIFRERGKINADVTGRLAETLGGIRIVKAYSAERRERYVFAAGAHRIFRNVAQSMTAISGTGAFATAIVGGIGVLMILVGGGDVLAGRMTVGDLIMYVFFTGLMAAPMVQIAAIGTQITEAFAGLDRIREIRLLATEDQEDAVRVPVGDIRGDVAFDDVWFEYNPDVPVIKGVSFTAPAGTTTALVGASGGGKSTLISLVMAFNRPKSGRVLIDGRDLNTIRLYEYRRAIGVVLQENFLFDGTVADNIAFARPHATREQIEAVAKIAHADEFIRGFEDGLRLGGGRARNQALRRPAAAHRHCARHSRGPEDPHPRRGHQFAGQRERGADPGRPPGPAPRPDDVRDRAPTLDHRDGGPDSRGGGRENRRTGNPPRAAGAGRAVSAVV